MIKLVYTAEFSDDSAVTHAEMHIGDDASIPDICGALKRFLSSCGYMINYEDDIVFEQSSDRPNEKLQNAAANYQVHMGKMQLELDEYNKVGTEYAAYEKCPCTNCQQIAGELKS